MIFVCCLAFVMNRLPGMICFVPFVFLLILKSLFGNLLFFGSFFVASVRMTYVDIQVFRFFIELSVFLHCVSILRSFIFLSKLRFVYTVSVNCFHTFFHWCVAPAARLIWRLCSFHRSDTRLTPG